MMQGYLQVTKFKTKRRTRIFLQELCFRLMNQYRNFLKNCYLNLNF